MKSLKKLFEIMKVVKKGNMKLNIIAFAFIAIACNYSLFSQNSSPANWLYPDGNMEATRYIQKASEPQIIDSMIIKWSTPFISGDVRPLIGNIVSNPNLFNFPYAPNEIAAVMGEDLVIIGGTGTLLKKARFPIEFVEGFASINGISCLIDTTTFDVKNYSTVPMVMGLSTAEVRNPNNKDSLAYSYVFGYQNLTDSIIPVKSLAINLSDFAPNIFASVKPIYGKLVNGNLMVYATVNMSQPKVMDKFPIDPPFFRGLASFYDEKNSSSYPLPDIADMRDYRAIIGPEVNNGQPSVFDAGAGDCSILLPNFPTTADIDSNFESLAITSYLNGDPLDTFADWANLVGLRSNSSTIAPLFSPIPFIPQNNETRPLIRPYYVDITDSWSGQRGFILVAEEYSGVEGSDGISKLHLYSPDGTQLTDINLFNNPPFIGNSNHYWSVAIGNVDGISDNSWGESYPNNTGNELIITQTSRDFIYPGSRLYVMRYYTGPEVIKPTPAGDFLYQLDTICSHRINGWVAAVNDLDGASDEKDEIVLVDGGKIMVVRLKDYSNEKFRSGQPFDTLFSHNFFGQTISHISVSDLEGDGKNDIVVTTYDSTYIIGSIISKSLAVISPKSSEYFMREYCAGDSLTIKWLNIIYSNNKVNIRFQPYLNGIPLIGQDTLLYTNIPNNLDTVSYSILIDEFLIGKTGKFVIEGAQTSTKLFDTTTVLMFRPPLVSFDGFTNSVFSAGSEIKISGITSCADSVALELYIDSVTYQRIAIDTVNYDLTYNLTGTIPCINNYFSCNPPDKSNYISFNIIAFKDRFADTLKDVRVIYIPEKFPVNFDTTFTANPTREFYWNSSDIDNLNCTNLSIAVSTDGGSEFFEIGNVPVTDGSFRWEPPLNIRDTVIVRFCCENTCVRTDTVLYDIKPKYISTVSPNPFRPSSEMLTIVYSVPEETTVTIKIFDAGDRIVSQPVTNVSRLPGIAYGDEWDGRRPDGSFVANGMYYISLELSNGIREIYPVFVRK